MKKQHISGFFDRLVATPAFVFLCAMFLCGVLAGGATGLAAGAQDRAVSLTDTLRAAGQGAGGVLTAAGWMLLPLACYLLRPSTFFLSGIAAARGFVLALAVGVGLSQQSGTAAAVLCTGLPAVINVPLLLCVLTMVWLTAPRHGLGQYRSAYLVCLTAALGAALLRLLLSALLLQ